MLSIRTRLMLLAMIAVVPLGFERIQSLETMRSEQIRFTHNEMMEFAQRGAESHTEMVKSVRSLLSVLAHTDAIDRGLGHDCRSLEASVESMPWIGSLSLADATGNVVCSSMADRINLDISTQMYFRDAIASGKPVLSDYLVGPLTSKPTMLIAQPLQEPNGSARAVLIAVLNHKWIERLFASVERRPGTSVTLVNGKGRLISRYPNVPKVLAGSYVGDYPIIREILNQDEGQASGIALDGLHRIRAFVRMPETDSRLMIGLDERKALGQIDRQVGLAYLQFGMFILIALLAAWIGGERLIVDPIRSLAKAATRLGRGDIDARIPREGWAAEFVPLANAFDEMTKRLAVRERELRAANRHYEELASVDSLTGLANRRAFDARLKAEWLRATLTGQPLALLLFDVDHFKTFNDLYGHLEGDTCLRHVGESLASVANGPADFAARYGGDEFALLLPGADEPQALAIAERLRKAVDIHRQIEAGTEYSKITLSIGAASLVPDNTDEPQSLIAAADMGLYAAKDRGRDSAVGHGMITVMQPG